MKREDLNKYNTNTVQIPTGRTEGEFSRSAGATTKTAFGMLWKAVKTLLFVIMISGLLVLISVGTYVMSYRNIEPPNLASMSLDYSSFVYVEDNDGNWVEYLTLHDIENRVWVDYPDIPQIMIESLTAIEDKRFFEHKGVDWKTTFGAAYKLVGGGGGGGSTITQQLIKNLTGKNQVSFTRKIEEIFMALNLEKNHTKSEILEAYLNVVNFGGGTRGVQAAANLYFGKDISQCSIAECASIAGITQYPYLHNPLYNAEANKKRQQTIIDEMYRQKKITHAEFLEAMEESENMHFVGYVDDDEDDDDEDKEDVDVWNWYMEAIFRDLIDDLVEVQNVSRDIAISNIYTNGFEIYAAMNVDMQEGVENFLKNTDTLPADQNVNFGAYVMDYTGRTLAIGGSRYEKTGNRWLSMATQAYRQTGSSIKPLSVYAPAFETGEITYGTVLEDEPIKGYFDDGTAGPNNFEMRYRGSMNVDKAIEMSQNAPAARLVKEMGPQVSFDFLQDKLHFSNLDPVNDVSLSTMALGGLTNGATVKEMTAAFQIFGNAGVYNKPFTYYYVKDHEENTIIDNREGNGEQVMTPENATIMNDLLQGVMTGEEGTGRAFQIDGVESFAKTGTTDRMGDIWFVGGTPYALAGLWNGYTDGIVKLDDSHSVRAMWQALMRYLIDNQERFGLSPSTSGYRKSDNVVTKIYCRSSGLLAGGSCTVRGEGLYSPDNIPHTCNGTTDHIAKGAPTVLPSTSPSAKPSVSPSPPISSGLESEVSSGIDPPISTIDPPVSSEVDPPEPPSQIDPTPGEETPTPPDEGEEDS